jgi:hypothetical protein
MTKLLKAQMDFVRCTGELIAWAYANGWQLTYGEAERAPEQAKLMFTQGKGTLTSLHMQRLAVDFNLFKDGVYMPTSDAHKPLGTYWKSRHPLARWGGDFKPRPDGNHYSFEWDGHK